MLSYTNISSRVKKNTDPHHHYHLQRSGRRHHHHHQHHHGDEFSVAYSPHCKQRNWWLHCFCQCVARKLLIPKRVNEYLCVQWTIRQGTVANSGFPNCDDLRIITYAAGDWLLYLICTQHFWRGRYWGLVHVVLESQNTYSVAFSADFCWHSQECVWYVRAWTAISYKPGWVRGSAVRA